MMHKEHFESINKPSEHSTNASGRRFVYNFERTFPERSLPAGFSGWSPRKRL